MKGKRYADVDAIQKATAILNAIPKNDLKKSFDNLLDSANRCAKGTISKATNKMFAKENQFFIFFIKSWKLLNSTLYVSNGQIHKELNVTTVKQEIALKATQYKTKTSKN